MQVERFFFQQIAVALLLLFAAKDNCEIDSTDQSSHTLTADVLMLSIISKHFVFQINLPIPSCEKKQGYVQVHDSQKSMGEDVFFPLICH